MAPLAVKETESPEHSVEDTGDIFTDGGFKTFIVTVFEFLHPKAPVPITVYVVVVLGFAITMAPMVSLKPDEGLHKNVLAPPPAFKITESPKHIDEADDEMLIPGNEFTATVITLVLEQPSELVPVIVYVVVEDGFAVTVDPTESLNPVEGLHL